MGLDLKHESFLHWMEDTIPYPEKTSFLKGLASHIGVEPDFKSWEYYDDQSSNVGSYTAYAVFLLFIEYLPVDPQVELAPDESGEVDEFEVLALQAFRKEVTPGKLEAPGILNLTEVPPHDALFIPVWFESPYVVDNAIVASKLATIEVLQAIAQHVGFHLDDEPDPEYDGDTWLPVETVKNITRIMHKFFVQVPNACVRFA